VAVVGGEGRLGFVISSQQGATLSSKHCSCWRS